MALFGALEKREQSMPRRVFNLSEIIPLWVHCKFVNFCFFDHNGLDLFLVKLVWLVSMSLYYPDALILVQPYF